MRTRRGVQKVEADPADQTLLWYGRAIGVLKSRPLNNPLSWRYQAAIHAYDRARDPYADAGDVLPGSSEQGRFWNQCQHSSWYFLPWHRMYLHHFEQLILRVIVDDLGGPADWALPYWNYSRVGTDARRLPAAFRSPTLPDGSNNHLYVPQRNTGANAGSIIADGRDVDTQPCLTRPQFTGTSADTQFGGPQTSFSHGGGPPGTLEWVPHGTMHGAVGGSSPTPGFMSRFNTAGLDPIFWLHHSNIDRLWEVWKARDSQHKNPSSAQWLRGVGFWFHDAQGNEVKMFCDQVLTTTAGPLGYDYDDIVDPLDEDFGLAATAGGSGMEQLIGATEQPFEIDVPAKRCVVHAPRAAAAEETFGIGANVSRVYLQIEHLTCKAVVPALDIYLGLSEDDNPDDYPEKWVSRMPLFGIVEATELRGPHAGSGLNFTLDVTDAIENLPDVGDDNFRDIAVTLHPVGEISNEKVRVGRVSLYAE